MWLLLKGSQRLRRAFYLLFVSMIKEGRAPLSTSHMLSVSVVSAVTMSASTSRMVSVDRQ